MQKGIRVMKGSVTVVKGRVEEAAGALTNNNRLRAKGRTDQTVGTLKQDAEKDVRKAKGFARKVLKKAKEVGQESVSKAKKLAAEVSVRPGKKPGRG